MSLLAQIQSINTETTGTLQRSNTTILSILISPFLLLDSMVQILTQTINNTVTGAFIEYRLSNTSYGRNVLTNAGRIADTFDAIDQLNNRIDQTNRDLVLNNIKTNLINSRVDSLNNKVTDLNTKIYQNNQSISNLYDSHTDLKSSYLNSVSVYNQGFRDVNNTFNNQNNRIGYLENELTSKLQYLPVIEGYLQEQGKQINEGFVYTGSQIIDFNNRLNTLENNPNNEMTPDDFRVLFAPYYEAIKTDIQTSTNTQINTNTKLNQLTNNKIDNLALLPVPQPLDIDFSQLITHINKTKNDLQTYYETEQKKLLENDYTQAYSLTDLGMKIGLIGIGMTNIATQTTNENLSSMAKSGACQALNGGCSINPKSGSPNASLNNLDDLLDGTNTLLGGVNLQQITEVNTKLGSQIPNGGIGGKLTSLVSNFDNFKDKFFKNTVVDRALKIIDTTLLIHNATMLSRDLVETLGGVIDLSLQALGLNIKSTDENGNEIQLQFTDYLGKSIKDFIVDIVGSDAYRNAVLTWRSFNRIYQTGANLLYNVRDLIDESSDYSERGLEQINKWMNVAKRDGLVAENAYPTQPENVPPKSRARKAISNYENNLEAAETALDNIAQIASVPITISSNLVEINESNNEFKAALNQNSDDIDEELTDSKLNSEAPVTFETIDHSRLGQ